RVWQPDAPTHVGDIWALDVTAGPYGDRFRLTFRKSDPAAAGAIFGVSVLEREGPVAGDRNDISVSGPLSVTVLPTDGIRLALDLNADGRADLELFDRIYQPSGTDPASPSEERSHDMLAIGPALPSGATFSFAVTRWTTTAGSSTPRAQDEAVASAARAITGLQQQQRVGTLTGRAGTLQGEIDDVELLLTQVRAQAHSGHMISDALFRTWDTIARDLIVVRVQLDAGGVNPELQRNAATHAGEFYDALDAETRSERRMSAGRTGVYVANVYTGESGNLSNPDFQTPRVVIVSAIQQGRWDDAVAAYRRLAEG